jgi:hypothetical protein
MYKYIFKQYMAILTSMINYFLLPSKLNSINFVILIKSKNLFSFDLHFCHQSSNTFIVNSGQVLCVLSSKFKFLYMLFDIIQNRQIKDKNS